MLLAIDSASSCLSLALYDGAALLGEMTLRAGRRQGALAAPLIEQLLQGAGVETSALTALAVAIGPGSYTGARIGVALAKGMAAAADLPLVPVTTLEIVAAACQPSADARPLLATVAAGRGRVIWAEYRWRDGGWQEARPPALSDWGGLLRECPRPALLSGEIPADALSQAGGADIQILPAAQRLRRAGFLAEIAWMRLRQNEEAGAFAAERVMPLYMQTAGGKPAAR